MKTQTQKKQLTFGDFVAGSYRAWGKRRAGGIIRLAIKARWIEFLGQHRYEVS
jgi:hypothetical protein